MNRLFRSGLLLIAVAFAPAAALAQSATGASPDKSGYSLFDPTPDDQMRSFCTDRPPKANLPCTVDAGHFQYEADLLNWSHTQYQGVTTDLYLYANPTLKLGLTNLVDFEFNMAPSETLATHGPFGHSTVTGVSDAYFRAKVNLAGPEGGDFQAAIIPWVKAPSAAPGLGNRAVDGGVIAPVSFALSKDYTLLFDPEVDDLRNAANFGRHANYQLLANVSRPVSSSVTGAVELWGQADEDPTNRNLQASFDLTLAWVVWDKLPNLQFDTGVFIGLTPATPKVQAFLGVSQRF